MKLENNIFIFFLLMYVLLVQPSCVSDNKSTTAPQINSTPSVLADINQPFEYQLEATNLSDENELTYSAKHPDWLTFDKENGRLYGQPTAKEKGNHPVELIVSDGHRTTIQSFILTVDFFKEVEPLIIRTTEMNETFFNQIFSYPNPVDGKEMTYTFELATTKGDTVMANQSGIVKYISQGDAGDIYDFSPANYVFVEQEDGSKVMYTNFQKEGVFFKVGDTLKVGSPIGVSIDPLELIQIAAIRDSLKKKKGPVEP